jgi:hypothetical protein
VLASPLAPHRYARRCLAPWRRVASAAFVAKSTNVRVRGLLDRGCMSDLFIRRFAVEAFDPSTQAEGKEAIWAVESRLETEFFGGGKSMVRKRRAPAMSKESYVASGGQERGTSREELALSHLPRDHHPRGCCHGTGRRSEFGLTNKETLGPHRSPMLEMTVSIDAATPMRGPEAPIALIA